MKSPIGRLWQWLRSQPIERARLQLNQIRAGWREQAHFRVDFEARTTYILSRLGLALAVITGGALFFLLPILYDTLYPRRGACHLFFLPPSYSWAL